MCAPLFAIWVGRHNNGPIKERPGEVRGGNVNTRVVKLQPLNKDSKKENDGGEVGRENPDAGLKEERRDQKVRTI